MSMDGIAPALRGGAMDAPARVAGSAPTKPVALDGKLSDPMGPRIRFGLGAVKGVGSSALEAIFETRTGTGPAPEPGASNGHQPPPSDTAPALRGGASSPAEPRHEPFTDLFDFTCRVDLRRVNKAVVEALVQCGAMDSLHEPLGIHRAHACAAVDTAIERGKAASADRASGQTDLFGMFSAEAAPGERPASAPERAFPAAAPWDRKELLKREKATLGFYLSGHPLDGYKEELKRFCNGNTISVENFKDGTQVTIGGVIEDFRVRSMKSGGKVAFFQLEDPFGRVEVIVRERALDAHREVLQSDAPVLLTGMAREERDQGGPDGEIVQGGEVKIVLDSVALLVDAFRSRTRSVRVRVHVDRVDKQKLLELRRTLEDFPGACPVTLQLVSDEAWHVTMGTKKILVDPSEAMLARLERLFGEKVCELR
jgi:DNA polymerase-3 subunit alpha